MLVRRLAMLIALSAALGVSTTIAVAWSLAAWLPYGNLRWSWANDPPGVQYSGALAAPRVQIDTCSRAGMVRRAWFVPNPDILDQTSPLAPALWGRSKGPPRPDPIVDRSWGDLPPSPAGATSVGVEDARGWPFLALWYGMAFNAKTGRVEANGGLPLSGATASLADFRALPLRPIPRGLLLDSAFYAAVWSALLTVVATRPLRRLRRRARGHCPACGYDLAGLPACPKCGRGRA